MSSQRFRSLCGGALGDGEKFQKFGHMAEIAPRRLLEKRRVRALVHAEREMGVVQGAASLPKELSADALDRRLGLRKRARADGAANLPAPEAEALSRTEQAILDALAPARADLDRQRRDAAAQTEGALRAAQPAMFEADGAVLDARLALKQVEARLSHDWKEAVADAAEARADLDAFKRENQLRRVAVYPQSTLLQLGLLLCAALFEALFSAALFAEEDERGLLGGVITAVGLSGANVTLGFLAGFLGLRYLQHVRRLPKVMGALAFATLGLLGLMLNLFAADWRDQLALLAGRQLEMGADAGFHLWSLLQLNSPQSIILLMLGAGVWVFAALKGYSGFDDPYPDFGKLDRAAKRASETLADLRAEAMEALHAPIDAARASVAARMKDIRAAFDAMQRAFDSGALAVEALDAQLRALDAAAAAAVALYRSENAAARTAPPPTYFATPLAPGALADVLVGSATLVDEARQRVRAAQDQSTQALEALLQELSAATARLDGETA